MENIISPLIIFLKKHQENHAFISNHLATAAAALLRWYKIDNDREALAKSKEIINKIISKQSKEGWYLEYEGFDPGYQSLCTYYLSDIYQNYKSKKLEKSLVSSINFIKYFVHPDGSFGGAYGSRSTRIFYPSGFLLLQNSLNNINSLNDFLHNSIKNECIITLSSVDESNLIPMFNSYCWASVLKNKFINVPKKSFYLPCFSKKNFIMNFKDAGLIVKREKNAYTIISYFKGGIVYHFVNNKLNKTDLGVVYKNKQGYYGSTQSYERSNIVKFQNSAIIIESSIIQMTKKLPSPYQFLLLRILCITVFKSYFIREWVKIKLVKKLITHKKVEHTKQKNY